MNVNINSVIEVDYSDFEKEVKDAFGQDYSFVADVECGNDSSHQYTVDGKVYEDEEEDIEEFKSTGKYGYLAGTLLNKLAQMGRIERGDYIVEVCW